jgi:hypothetical protein
MRDMPLVALFGVLFVLLLVSHTTPSASAELKTVTFNGMTLSEETAKQLKGGCDTFPYAELEKFNRGGKITPVWTNGRPEAGIDPALACRVLKMLQAASERGCRPYITSGYRSEAQQANMCGGGSTGCARAGNSCHQYGLAVDMNAPCLSWLRQVAPEFHLIQNNIPGDPYHFQCAEHRYANRSSCTSACNGGLTISPDSNVLANTPMSQAPMGLGDYFRNALYGPPPPQQLPPPQQVPPVQQMPPVQQPLPSSQSPLTQLPPPPSPTPTPPGVPTTPTVPTTPGSTTASTSLDTWETYEPFEKLYDPDLISDYLLNLAYGPKEDEKEKSEKTIPLVIDSKDSGTLQGKEPGTVAIIQPIQDTQTLTYQQPETFVSNTANQPPPSGFAQPTQTGFLAILDQLRAALVALLDILRPFGLRNAMQVNTHGHGE